jgi:hypothetical protein
MRCDQLLMLTDTHIVDCPPTLDLILKSTLQFSPMTLNSNNLPFRSETILSFSVKVQLRHEEKIFKFPQ